MNSRVRQRSQVEVAPGLDWLDRVTGRAAVDPVYRELLFTRPALALTGEPLPAGLLADLARIHTRDLFEYARLAIAAEAAHRPRAAERRDPLARVDGVPGQAAVGAAA